jgi:secreted PhoX family phosphatase
VSKFFSADPQDDLGRNPSANADFAAIVEARISRRTALGGLLALGGTALLPRANASTAQSSLGFASLPKRLDGTHHVASGYAADILLRWGDPLLAGSPAFDPAAQTVRSQSQQFGYNNDYLAFLPLPFGSANSERGLLWANHESTNPRLMFAGLHEPGARMTRALVDIELAAHGGSVVEIGLQSGKWQAVRASRYNRRITMTTPMRVAGPAAGHERMTTSADRSGRRVLGTLNNCSGGKTPWGTVLSGEENFHFYFSGDAARTAEAGNYARYGVGQRTFYPWWAEQHGRFDLAQEAREANRFGWVVEIDPYDPLSTPVKRTALGRFKHEGATCVLNRDGRVVVYCGDDEINEYVYRFVSAGRFDPRNRRANMKLLDSGTLSVARFEADGTMRWLPLVQGEGPLTPDNGFHSQADVAIETRRAADLVGATKMDRPEDVEANPLTGVVYVMLANNVRRTASQVDAANPRANNAYGHVIALVPPGSGPDADHAAGQFTWSIPILAGNPHDPKSGARYGAGDGEGSWFVGPDNVAFDPRGRMYIATDQGALAETLGTADGIWVCDVEGPAAYRPRCLFQCPIGAEMCGPEFTPDGRTLFVAVQHPAVAVSRPSTFENPATRWPDFDPALPPRPSVVAIRREDGGPI